MEENNLTTTANANLHLDQDLDLALNRFSRRRSKFASFIIFDMEASGFKRRPRVTELCMIAVQVDEIKSAKLSFPRVINKIQLCFNPESVIDPTVCTLTGLYNDALEQMATFREQAALISGFLASQPQPACLIAHNGLQFDFPLLQAELRKAKHTVGGKADVWCTDSWQAFRVLDGLCAIPAWLASKIDKEKQMKSQMVNKTAADQGASNRETDIDNPGNRMFESDSASAVNGNKDGVRDADDVSTGHSSPAKRHAQATEKEENNSLSASKHLKQYHSQLSITDAQLLTACDILLPEQSGEHTAQTTGKEPQSPMATPEHLKQESVPSLWHQLSVSDSELHDMYDALLSDQSSSKLSAAAGNPLQCQGERTPDQSASHISGTDVEKVGHLFKKQQTLPVDPKERQSVARRLFEETLTGTVNSHTPDSAPVSKSTRESSYKLAEIYKREFGHYPAVSHTAEDDCIALLKLILKKSSQFIDFVEESAVCFNTIEPMF